MVGWLDPISIATNAYTIVIHPYFISLINSFFGFLHKFHFISFVSDPVHAFLKEALFALHAPFFRGHVVFLIVISAIIFLGLFYKRYWCRNLCPLGALLALLSGWSIFKRGIVGSFHKVSAKYMPLYVAEFQFRYNNRFNADKAVDFKKSLNKRQFRGKTISLTTYYTYLRYLRKFFTWLSWQQGYRRKITPDIIDYLKTTDKVILQRMIN